MESLVGEMAVLLQEIRQRERAGTLDLEEINALEDALKTACTLCEEVLHPAPPAATTVEQEQEQEQEPQPPQKASGAKAKTAEK